MNNNIFFKIKGEDRVFKLTQEKEGFQGRLCQVIVEYKETPEEVAKKLEQVKVAIKRLESEKGILEARTKVIADNKDVISK